MDVVSYCEEWNKLTNAPLEPLTEKEARRRFTDGPWFTCVLHDGEEIPSATLEVVPQARVVKVFGYTPAGSVELIKTYRRTGDQMFMVEVVHYEYMDDEHHLQMDAAIVESISYRTDGVGRRTYDDASSDTIQISDRDGIDLSPNWAPVPKFGEWAELVNAQSLTR